MGEISRLVAGGVVTAILGGGWAVATREDGPSPAPVEMPGRVEGESPAQVEMPGREDGPSPVPVEEGQPENQQPSSRTDGSVPVGEQVVVVTVQPTPQEGRQPEAPSDRPHEPSQETRVDNQPSQPKPNERAPEQRSDDGNGQPVPTDAVEQQP